MRISDVKIRKMVDEDRLKAIVSVTFDNEFCVHDIKIIEHDGKCFLAMPSKKVAEGEFKDIVHPINMTFRNHLEDEVLSVYEQEVNNNIF